MFVPPIGESYNLQKVDDSNCRLSFPVYLHSDDPKDILIVGGRTKAAPMKYTTLYLSKWDYKLWKSSQGISYADHHLKTYENDSKDPRKSPINISKLKRFYSTNLESFDYATGILWGNKSGISKENIKEFQWAYSRLFFPFICLDSSYFISDVDWHTLTHMVTITCCDAFTCASPHTVFSFPCNLTNPKFSLDNMSKFLAEMLKTEISEGLQIMPIKYMAITGCMPKQNVSWVDRLHPDWEEIKTPELSGRVYLFWLMLLTHSFMNFARKNNIDLSPDATWGLR